MKPFKSILMLLPASLVVGCGGEANTGPGPDGEGDPATVSIVYLASTSIDPTVAQNFPQCVNGVGRTHVHPSWLGFSRIDMIADGADRWVISLAEVPTGTRLAIRISDPNVCSQNPTGASTENVFVNDVLLSDVVDTPGSGIEPGLAFTLNPDGSVDP